jgi:hypothetical protein
VPLSEISAGRSILAVFALPQSSLRDEVIEDDQASLDAEAKEPCGLVHKE